MRFPAGILRAAATLLLFDLGMMYDSKAKPYPLQVHHMYRDRLLKKAPKTVGVWSAWGPWTTCSRSCGGGVTQQTRHCINRPADTRFVRGQRRRRQANGCVGLYKRIHLCNSQNCPSGRDFRYEQCAAFNHRLFKGKTYVWEPFLNAPDECALNCRASGLNFYATLNKTVIDGTSCSRPLTSYGRPAPRGTRGVCIEGSCKSVSANGIIGAVDEQEECSACMKGKCRSINGIYTRVDLPPGYSLVAQIPQGACRILVQQLKHTRNHLALRNANGSFIVNGDWKINNPGVIDGAGARFTYIKQDVSTLETISSPGPLANPVDIMIVNFQTNHGVKYGYSLPIDSSTPLIAPPLLKRPDSGIPEPRRLETSQRDEARPLHRRTRLRRRFAWKISGVSACSKSCGGGLQATVVTCVREHTQTPVPDRRCAHLEKPMTQPIRCNLRDCPARWEAHWSPCSVTCGEGVQHYVPQCHQELSTGRSVVTNEGSCPRPKPPSQAKPCMMDPCESIRDNELPQTPERLEWSVGAWSACSVSCGTGHRTRSVTCPSGRCPPEDRPKYAEYCENGPCSATSESSPWLLTEWSHCSESCGTGSQSRLALCPHSNCTDHNKPETSRACSSDKQCGGQWVTGPWSPCPDSCSETPVQKRDVFCVVKIRGQAHITNEMTCPVGTKPPVDQPCAGTCPPMWFFGEWGVCECPAGVQRREVRCMDVQGRGSNGCEGEVPPGKRQCGCSRIEEHRHKPAQDEPADRSCVDRIRNCYLAVQARLCQYPYYTNHCCVSCKRAQQDLFE
ncbi:thrombospondin type-1 domain-containing protein 4 [Tribolium castaneum]|uniref:thrombospondin type-1 domain-containing protein 4 n=1 Tax=Tribolium castaneum TaxID=7070 RepID=UPI00046C2B71|nr:PREDICTED: thrombospondin type-1 domain-containing protein 4 [Tribolium castaneum]|eukprot:XP_008195650.1 PREDICTED: thrombospondin type-1 domain-containing protein 4 [Tribolium castaneum]